MERGVGIMSTIPLMTTRIQTNPKLGWERRPKVSRAEHTWKKGSPPRGGIQEELTTSR